MLGLGKDEVILYIVFSSILDALLMLAVVMVVQAVLRHTVEDIVELNMGYA